MYSAENNIRNTARQTKERQGRSRRTRVDDLRHWTGMKIHDDIKFGTLPLLEMYQHVSTIVRCQLLVFTDVTICVYSPRLHCATPFSVPSDRTAV